MNHCGLYYRRFRKMVIIFIKIKVFFLCQRLRQKYATETPQIWTQDRFLHSTGHQGVDILQKRPVSLIFTKNRYTVFGERGPFRATKQERKN